jgi:hypothetical protein
MNLDFLYINGCSHTAGGGLYENSIKDEYKKLYNLEWGNEREITYSRYVADYFNLKRIDDSQCGSGAPRLIRKTFEYIDEVGIENAKKSLFLLQINGSINRVEIFCKEINDYVIVDIVYNDDGSFRFFDVVEKWSHTEKKYPYNFFDGKIKEEISNILKDYHDPFVYQKKIQHELLGLFSFLDKYEIEYFYFPDDKYCLGNFANMNHNPDKHHVRIGNSSSCHEWTTQNNLTIKDELNGFTQDFHPGYYGHKKYSHELIMFLKNRI